MVNLWRARKAGRRTDAKKSTRVNTRGRMIGQMSQDRALQTFRPRLRRPRVAWPLVRCRCEPRACTPHARITSAKRSCRLGREAPSIWRTMSTHTPFPNDSSSKPLCRGWDNFTRAKGYHGGLTCCGTFDCSHRERLGCYLSTNPPGKRWKAARRELIRHVEQLLYL